MHYQGRANVQQSSSTDDETVSRDLFESDQHDSTPPELTGAELDRLLYLELENALAEMNGNAPMLPRMARYHLGMVDSSGAAVEAEVRITGQGKRMRPLLAVLSCMAAGGNAEAAAPIAAAIELLHNFSLVHDDIQDRSPNRRHRATVWRVWGDAQAINVGDALFAASHLAVLHTRHDIVAPEIVLELTAEFNRMTIAIVRGQVLDLEFEGRSDVQPEDYLGMITGKTAAIVEYAAWAGSLVGGASQEDASQYAKVGLALGIGFQIRDDLLGIWGAREETGKEVADDIRRRKQSLPILRLRSQASPEDTELLNGLYAREEIDEGGVIDVLRLLEKYGIQQQVLGEVRTAHRRANDALAGLALTGSNPGFQGIASLIARMQDRLS